MWQNCVDGFEKQKKGMRKGMDEETGKVIYSKPQPKIITELGRELIKYYSERMK